MRSHQTPVPSRQIPSSIVYDASSMQICEIPAVCAPLEVKQGNVKGLTRQPECQGIQVHRFNAVHQSSSDSIAHALHLTHLIDPIQVNILGATQES